MLSDKLLARKYTSFPHVALQFKTLTADPEVRRCLSIGRFCGKLIDALALQRVLHTLPF
jgi:hypothetical protein